MAKTDLTQYGTDELIDNVINDESLYRMMNHKESLFEVLEQVFIFDEDQREALEEYLEDEENLVWFLK